MSTVLVPTVSTLVLLVAGDLLCFYLLDLRYPTFACLGWTLKPKNPCPIRPRRDDIIVLYEYS